MILSVITYLSQRNNEIQWNKVFHDIVSILPFTVVFIVNNSWLTNKFLFKKKYLWYFGISGVIIVVFSHPKLTFLLHDLIQTKNNPDFAPPIHPRPGPQFSPFAKPPRGVHLDPHRVGMEPIVKGHFIRYMNNMLLSTLVIGFNTAIKQAGRLVREERLRHQLSEEKLQAELSFLKHQISPHFLMNTLNNIHALVELEPKGAQNSIVRLSHMLRYLLYEKEDKKTSLLKEVEFIKSYCNLMKMRYTDDLEVKLNIPDKIPPVSIPPFVFITILENAFKHGASINKPCFIHLSIVTEDKYLTVICSNSKQKEPSLPSAESSGIGLVNTRQRLDLYYGNDYIWEVDETDDTYTSTIKLPIYEN